MVLVLLIWYRYCLNGSGIADIVLLIYYTVFDVEMRLAIDVMTIINLMVQSVSSFDLEKTLT